MFFFSSLVITFFLRCFFAHSIRNKKLNKTKKKNSRDEERDKSCDRLKSSSSEESVRKRRPSGNISINSQLSIFSQTSMSTDADVAQANSRKHHNIPFHNIISINVTNLFFSNNFHHFTINLYLHFVNRTAIDQWRTADASNSFDTFARAAHSFATNQNQRQRIDQIEFVNNIDG